MLRNEKESFPPSYSESIGQAQQSRSRDPQRGQNILDQLTLVRAQHIRSVIDTHIIPLVEERAGYGIAQTIIAMLPSDIPLPPVEEKSEFSFEAEDKKNVEVIGFSSDEEPKVVRLEGQLNKTEFWRPQVVIVELETVLRESLNASPHIRSPTTSRYTEFEAQERPQKRSFFSRITGSSREEEPSPGGNPEVGVKLPDTGGQVLVKARLEEICLRTVTGFGLYDTITKQCVIIRIDARC